MIPYDSYNREERNICSHLFRLLHENLDQKNESPLGRFLDELASANPRFEIRSPDLRALPFKNVAIYSEVALIRDAYYHRKEQSVNDFMDKLTRMIMKQEKVDECRPYSKLPGDLANSKKTHPKQIRLMAEKRGVDLSEEELKVYGSMQGMFNAKPDLTIILDDVLLVCEAKFTLGFDENQMHRTWNIAQVWAEILYKDLGFATPPAYTVFKLGAQKYDPHVSWEFVNGLVKKVYGDGDRSYMALKCAQELISNEGQE